MKTKREKKKEKVFHGFVVQCLEFFHIKVCDGFYVYVSVQQTKQIRKTIFFLLSLSLCVIIISQNIFFSDDRKASFFFILHCLPSLEKQQFSSPEHIEMNLYLIFANVQTRSLPFLKGKQGCVYVEKIFLSSLSLEFIFNLYRDKKIDISKRKL